MEGIINNLDDAIAQKGHAIFYIIGSGVTNLYDEDEDGEKKEKDFYKLGITENSLKQRLGTLQVGNPNKLFVFYWEHVQNGKGIEKYIHKKYQEKQIRGEWFNLNKTDMFAIIFEIELFLEKWSRMHKDDKTITERETIAIAKCAFSSTFLIYEL